VLTPETQSWQHLSAAAFNNMVIVLFPKRQVCNGLNGQKVWQTQHKFMNIEVVIANVM